MISLGLYPLVRDLELFLDVLRGQVPGPCYEVYVRDDVELEQCKLVYIVGWNEERNLVGCCEMSVTLLQMLDRTEVGPVVGFFRCCMAHCRTLFVPNSAWERWSAYEEHGKGLLKVAGM